MFEEILLSALITGLTVFIGTYIMSKKMISNGKKEFFAWLNSESGQKTIYSVGHLVGAGAKKGFDFNLGKGKMKWEDIAMRGISGWLEQSGFFSKPGESQQTEKPITPSLP